MRCSRARSPGTKASSRSIPTRRARWWAGASWLSRELDVIQKTKFADYFLVVWDIISFAREQGIYFGVRGSADASLALYCLGVTDVDPLAYGLVFERFLNVERRELPDIDLDFQDDRRDEVLAYVNQKYGSDHVAQIITFGTMGARAAIRDTGRALGVPYAQVDRVARLIPLELTITLDRALEQSRELHDIYHQDTAIRNLIDSARKLEGFKHAGMTDFGMVNGLTKLRAKMTSRLSWPVNRNESVC